MKDENPNLSRISKLLADRDSLPTEEGLRIRQQFAVTLVAGADVAASYMLQLSVLTAAKIAVRCFPGAVRVALPAQVDGASTLLWPDLQDRPSFGALLGQIVGTRNVVPDRGRPAPRQRAAVRRRARERGRVAGDLRRMARRDGLGISGSPAAGASTLLAGWHSRGGIGRLGTVPVVCGRFARGNTKNRCTVAVAPGPRPLPPRCHRTGRGVVAVPSLSAGSRPPRQCVSVGIGDAALPADARSSNLPERLRLGGSREYRNRPTLHAGRPETHQSADLAPPGWKAGASRHVCWNVGSTAIFAVSTMSRSSRYVGSIRTLPAASSPRQNSPM